MQSKDIPVIPVLEFLAYCATADFQKCGKWGTSHTNDGRLFENSVQHAMPAGVPYKVAQAKMASLIRRGLVSGCTCGCRGDFELTEKGTSFLEAEKATQAAQAKQARKFANADVYIVGGAVRDTLLGHNPQDRDYVVVGCNVEEMLAAGFRQVGADFPVFLHPETQDEYALARTERKSGHGYGGFTVNTEAVTLEEDLSRRDITINSMAMKTTGELVDPYGGAKDLADKTIRHTTMAFCEDPLRILRVARFLARFGPQWQVATETEALIQKMVNDGEADFLTPERVWKEIEKGLMEPHPVLMLQTFVRFGIVSRPPFVEYNQAQACYIDELAKAAGAKAPLEVRFALAFSRVWTTEEARESRIPALAREVSAAVCKISGLVANASETQASPDLLLNLLLTADALRQKDRFELILGAMDFLHPAWANLLRIAQQKVLAVNPEKVIVRGMKGPEIQERIRHARLAALAA
jgi:tRNA nucleotidyltransferase (CCA-adding enzyme)